MKPQNNVEYYSLKIDNETNLTLQKPKGVFTPTGTTEVLVREVKNYLRKPAIILDLGCGIGVTGLALHQAGLVKEPLYGSDIGQNAIDIFRLNSNYHNCKVIAKCGSVFEPWKNEKFDVIVDDISGVAEPVADISPWFRGVSCKSGIDGTDLIIEVISGASKHLNENGLLFFPVISFSNTKKIIKAANQNFATVRRLIRKEWPLPEEMYEHKLVLEELKADKNADYSEKFGLIIWYTDIYIAYNSMGRQFPL